MLRVHDKGFLISLCPTIILTIDVHLITPKILEDPLTKLDFPYDTPQSIAELNRTFIRLHFPMNYIFPHSTYAALIIIPNQNKQQNPTLNN